MAKQNLDIHIRPIDDGATSALDRLAQKAKEFRREDAMSGQKALGGFLNRGASGIADLALNAAGAGVAGLGLATLAKMGDKWLETLDALREHRKTGAEVLDGFMRSIPVLGEFYGLARHIREEFAGATEEVMKLEKEMKAMTAEGKNLAIRKSLSESMSQDKDSYWKTFLPQDAYEEMTRNVAFNKRMGGLQNDRQTALRQLGKDSNNTSAQRLLASADDAINSAVAQHGREVAATEARKAQLVSQVIGEAQNTLREAQSHALENSLRLGGKALEADLEAVKRDYIANRQKITDDFTKAQEAGRLGPEGTRTFGERYAQLERDREAAEQAVRERNAKNAFSANSSAYGTEASARVDILRRAGRGADADRVATGEQFDARLREMAGQLGDPSLTDYQRQSILRTMAYTAASRSDAMDKLGSPAVGFTARTAQSIGDADRFRSGSSESLTLRTAPMDTARNTKDLVKVANDIFKKLEDLARQKSGSSLSLALVSAVGG